MPKILGILSLAKNSTMVEASYSIWPKLVSLVIITYICIIINKLIKINSNILYIPSDITSSMISPNNILLH
jgi:hypothetical protein